MHRAASARVLPLFTLAAILLGTAAGCGPTSFLITPVPADKTLEEQEVLRESFWASGKIVVIDVDGMISNSRQLSLLGEGGEHPVSLFVEKLERAANDSSVKAVVVRINSPGGTVTASDLMYGELRNFRARTGKPVIACMLDVAASGGYYLACAADKIYAHPTTVTGSIGVIMITPEISGLMEKIGVDVNVIKSGELKDSGSPFRAMNPRDREVFQKMVDQMYARFLDVVKSSRKDLSEERIRELSDGRVYLAPDAKANGLIDEIGSLYDAVRAAKAAAGLEGGSIVLVQYKRPLSYRPNVYAQSPGGAPQVNLVNLNVNGWMSNPAPEFCYLWAPGY